jgi:tRNA modification GTPase
MRESSYHTDDTIAALATPWGTSALALIRASGTGCIEQLSALFRPSGRLTAAAGNTTVHGVLFDPQTEEPLDEVIVLVFRAPKSYTGEDGFDITCHGSLPGVSVILEALRRVGFRDAEPGEFTFRAFLNRKMDLTRAEAVREIVDSKSKQAHIMALKRLSGSIEKRIERLRERLLSVSARIELILDYPDDELDEEPEVDAGPLKSVIDDLESLLATFRTGRLFQEGARVSISGRTNAGKSSLFNLFLREDRSIVSETHGTTRDYIESWISIRGIPVSLFDTAGLRTGLDPVEEEGIRRTGRIMDASDLVLYLVDASDGLNDDDRKVLEDPKMAGRCIAVWNKIDAAATPAPAGFVPLSVATGEGFTALEDAIVEHFLGDAAATGDAAVIDSQRQKQAIETALTALTHVEHGIATSTPLDAVATDLKDALDAFSELSGEITSAEVLETMFSQFCVGK